jgi:hypothetical protein
MPQTRATDPPKKRLALSQDTDIPSTQENSQKPPEKKPVPKPQPPKKESYMSRMIRERGEKTEKVYKERLRKLYKEHAPEKVSKVDDLIKKYTYTRIHEVYLKVCKKYSAKAEAEFDGTDPDVMDIGEEKSAAPKISMPSASKDSGLNFKFAASAPKDSGSNTGFKFGDGSTNALGAFSFSEAKKIDTRKIDKNNKKPPLAKKPFDFKFGKKDEEKKDDAKPEALNLGDAFATSTKKSPFAFNPKSSTSSKPADKKNDLFGAAPSPNSFGLLTKKGKAVDFTTGSTNSTPISSKPKNSGGNPFAAGIKNNNSPQININFGGSGGGMKSNNSNNNRMSIASDMGGNNNGGMRNGNNGGNNPFATVVNDSPFARLSQQTNSQNKFTFNNPTSSQGSFAPAQGGFNLGKMSKKRRF